MIEKNLKADRTQADPTAELRLSRQREPEEMPADNWQRTVRRQFGRDQAFDWNRSSGDKPAPVLSGFSVVNPAPGSIVKIRPC